MRKKNQGIKGSYEVKDRYTVNNWGVFLLRPSPSVGMGAEGYGEFKKQVKKSNETNRPE